VRSYWFQLVKKFPVVYGIWRFITVFTRAHHLFLSWGRSIQFTPPSYFFKINFNIILPTVPRFSKFSLPLRFPHQHPVCSFPLSHTCHISFSLIDRPNIWWGVEIMMLFFMQSPQVLGYLVPLRPKCLSQYPILRDPQHMFLIQCERRKFHIHIIQPKL